MIVLDHCVVIQIAEKKNRLGLTQLVRRHLRFLSRIERHAALLEYSHQSLGFFLGAAVLRVQVHQPTVPLFEPGQESVRLGIERIKEPHLLYPVA